MMSFPGEDYQNPKQRGGPTQNLYVYVEDLSAHVERARAAGAQITSGPEETFYGDRRYGAVDPEGHHWFFAEKLRDVPPSAWHPQDEDLDGHR